MLAVGCPSVDEDDDDSAAGDDDDDTRLIEAAFALLAGLTTLECSALQGTDPSGTFTVGGVYGISVYAEDHTIQFTSNGGVLRTRTWDGVDDVITGEPGEDEQVLITIVEEDGGIGEVRWDPSYGGVVTARYGLAGGLDVYSFIASK